MFYLSIQICPVLPHLSESKTSDSGIHAMDSGCKLLDSSRCQCNLDSGFRSLVGFQIPLAIFRIQAKFLDPMNRIFPDSTFHEQTFPRFQILLNGATCSYKCETVPTQLKVILQLS